MSNATKKVWQELLYSKTLIDKKKSHKIAYIAVMTAFVVVANMFFEFKLADTQFSLTLAVSALAGILLGPIFGFVSCFLGDLVGFLYNSSGFAYMPWIGISMAGTASIFGFVINGVQSEKKWLRVLKILLASLLSFFFCTVAINTTAFWLLYSPTTSYWTYFVARFFVKGQIWNSLVNYAILFLLIPIIKRIK